MRVIEMVIATNLETIHPLNKIPSEELNNLYVQSEFLKFEFSSEASGLCLRAFFTGKRFKTLFSPSLSALDPTGVLLGIGKLVLDILANGLPTKIGFSG